MVPQFRFSCERSGAEESCRCLCVNLSNTVLYCTSFSYVLLRLTQRHRQLSSAPDLSQLNLNWGTIVIALISLLLAFATYAVLSGLIGTCCNTMEQSEPAIMIVTLLIMVGYIVSCFTPIISSNAVAAAVLSLCPVISVFCAPVSYVCGNISLIVLILSWVIQAIILVALSIFCAKVYRDLLLYRGSHMGISQLFQIFKNRKKEGATL